MKNIMEREKLLQIGVIAKEAEVNIQTIRYYERRNILKPAQKLDSGYRLYSRNAIKAIKFIKHAQDLGFKLDDIKQLLSLRAPSVIRCESVQKKALERLSDIQEKIAMLRQIEKTIQILIKDCQKNKTSEECPIIDGMEINE